MGVANLWTELAKYAEVCRCWNGSSAEIVTEVCGKVLAIDASVWIFQASQQNDLRDAIFDEHARVLYIIIFRILNLLRYGVTPVFVLEGDTPEAKMGRLNQRSLARGGGGAAVGNRRGGRHDALGRRVVQLLDLMGLPHVEAPGEAEAMCAALSAVGLAHGVVTSDVDALMFGAGVVYRECRLQMDIPRNNCLERMDAAEVARRCFGIRGEGATCVRALQAVAVLSGCDYSVSGGRGVGVKTALDAVQQLTCGRQDDSGVLPELLRFLEVGPDPAITALTKCTGCKTCGHEKHGRQPCPLCGPGACKPRPEGSGCMCEFHRSEPQRKFMRTIGRAASTGPSFSAECRAALAAFQSETQRAMGAAEKLRSRLGQLSWSGRPDVNGVFDLMHPLLGNTSASPDKLLWTYAEVRDKLRPALLEWDMRQGPQPPAAARRVMEFRPRRIKQEAVKDGGTWAYLVEFDRIPAVNAPDEEFDRTQLADSRLSKGRHVRKSLIHHVWPQLPLLAEQEAQEKAAKPKKGRGKGKAGDSGTLGSPGGTATTTVTGATAAAAAGRKPAAAAAAAISIRSGASQGSSDVMMRFLQRGGSAAAAAKAAPNAAPTTSVQQQTPQRQRPARDGGGGGAGGAGAATPASGGVGMRPRGERTAAAVAGGAVQHADYGLGDDGEEDDMDFQMTQRNDGPGPSAGVAGAKLGTAVNAGAGPSGAGLGAGRSLDGGGGLGGLLPLFPPSDDDDDGGGGLGGGGGELNEALYGDLDNVAPSLDELLATRPSQQNPAAAPRAQQGRRAPNPDNGNGGDDADMDDGTAAGGSAGAGAEWPFRPYPTGPGPGRRCPPSAAAIGDGAAAAAAAAHQTAVAAAAAKALAEGSGAVAGKGAVRQLRSQYGGGGGAVSNVEVFDLTDSPAPVHVPPPRRRRVPADAGGGGGGGVGRVRELGPAAAEGMGDAGVGVRAAAQGRWESDDDDDVVMGSAVKPPVSVRTQDPAAADAAAASLRDASGGVDDGGEEEEDEEDEPGPQRALFPDALPPLAPVQSARPSQQPQPGASQQPGQRQSQHGGGASTMEDGGSPSKRRNLGGAVAAAAQGSGGQLPAAPVAATAAGAAVQVDLTLDDDDEECEEEVASPMQPHTPPARGQVAAAGGGAALCGTAYGCRTAADVGEGDTDEDVVDLT